ncbi:MAG: protein kinase [Deltaproteobacteria bacterium]|nr:protein kinase [Deltaproteobacteria bacterium]MBW2533582.1 protein kinase [Deltaproteobacteria bacterium]
MPTGTSQPSERFAIDSRIGGGAAGDIYKATDAETGQIVAVKLLRHTATRSEQARFHREIAVIRDLGHPNIVNYVAHGDWTDGRIYLAMEYLDGEDLAQRQRRQPLGMQDSVEVVRRAAQALAAIHSRGIVHRDLKLSNMFLVKGRGTAVKLIDFGVVHPAEPDGYDTEPGTILGTPHHMAPEQAQGEEVDPRADVYALGSVLFRLLTGRNVFETEHVIALLGRLVLEDPPRPSTIRFGIPEKLDHVVHTAISRNREMRYANAGDFARALARVGPVNNDPPQAEGSASVVRPTRRRRESVTGSSTDSHLTRPGLGVRRVVACVLYDLGETSVDITIGDTLVDVTGEDVRIETLAGGKTVAVLGVEHSRGDELMRAARAALTVISDFPEARVVVANGHAAMARSNLAGEALERAARQLESATAGDIRLDMHAAAALEGRFVVERDADGARLIREEPRDLAPRQVLGRPTPTVGREREIAQLQAMYADTLQDSFPRAAVVLGSAGIGKSRVRSELAARLELAPMPPEILLCRGDAEAGGASLSAFGKALRAQMGVQDGAEWKEQVQRVRRYVRSRLPRSLHFLGAFVGELVGVSFPDHADEPLRAARANDQLMKSRIRMALEAFIRTQAARMPQVVIVEDAQWADETSIELIEWLLACPDIRLAVFAFARREITARYPKLWPEARLERMELAPLPAVLSERVVSAALPDLDDRVRSDLVRRAGGNPLVLEELIRCAAEGRDELPLTVQALVQTRLDRLDARVQETLRAAAVFGQTFWAGGVATLLKRDVDEQLQAAAKAELIFEQPTSRVAGQKEWIYRQSLVREAAHASLLEEDRKALHLAAGEWLESVGSADVGVIASHYEQGGDLPKAASAYVHASQQALANFGEIQTALQLAERGLACGAAGEERAQLLVTQAQVQNSVGRLNDAITAAEEATQLVAPPSQLWVEAQRLLAISMGEAGRSGEADTRATWALSPEVGSQLDAAQRSVLLAARVRPLVNLSRQSQALAVATEAVAAAEEAGAEGANAKLRALDAHLFALANASDPAGAVEAGYSLIEVADQAGDLHLASRARINTSSSLNYLGQYEQAQALIERALPDVRSFRLRILEGSAIHNLGMSYARRGALDEGIDMQRQAVEIADECSSIRLALSARGYETIFLVWRGQPGDLRKAFETAQYIMEVTQTQIGQQIDALYALARVQLARRELQAAVEAAQEAHRRLMEGAAVEEWNEAIRVCYVDCLLALGREEEAEQAIHQAFEFLQLRVRAIGREDLRATYLSRNDEVVQLLYHARNRLGLELPPVGG